MKPASVSRFAAAVLVLVLASACQAIRPLEAIRSAIDRNDTTTAPSITGFDYDSIPQNRTRDGGFILGRRSAPVTMIVFQDYLCSHCQAYQPTVKEFIEKQVVPGDARFEYRFFPVIDATYSVLTADLTECAEILEPGTFWPAHDLMFKLAAENRQTELLDLFADGMNLDADDLMDCSQDDADQVETDQRYGTRLGVSGTPTVFLQFEGETPEMISPLPTYDQLEDLINRSSGRKET